MFNRAPLHKPSCGFFYIYTIHIHVGTHKLLRCMAHSRSYDIQQTCVKRPLKNGQNKDLNNKW